VQLCDDLGCELISSFFSFQDSYGIASSEPQQQEDLKALADYWRNPGSDIDKDAIDMSTLIMDAIENEDSVLDITDKIGQILDEGDSKK
jgi:hypothetical protein